jgi:tetratricopeptide (TPR) repeat protein
MATRLTGLSLVVALALAPRAADALPAVAELLREARAHQAAHEEDLALRRYAEALTLDPTEGDAYLELGALRLRLGDAREAVRVYDAGMSHVPGLALALVGRARAKRALGQSDEADADMEAYLATRDDPDALRELSRWYADDRRPLAQLGAWRRLLALAEASSDAVLRREARVTVHALELLVGAADPVREPPSPASTLRRGMARMEQRR